jgi:hypothetical protein
MWDNSVVTAGGSQLLSQWVDGSVLNITGAVGGTGTVDAGVLKDQTALTDQKQVLSIITREDVPGGIKLGVQITAPAVGYTLNQIGILANLNGGASTLIALYQDATGVPIPAASTVPDYVYTFYATLLLTNVGELTITVDPSALVTAETLANAVAVHNLDPASHSDKLSTVGDGKDVTVTFTPAENLQHIGSGDKLSTLFGKIKTWLVSLGTAAFRNVGTGANEVAAGVHPHGNLSSDGKYGSAANLMIGTGAAGAAEVKTAQQSADILKFCNKNILHNWDFRNPVNQRGQSSYATNGYTIDGWRTNADSVTLTVNAASITVAFAVDNFRFYHLVEYIDPAATYTLSFDVETVTGEVYFTNNTRLVVGMNKVTLTGLTSAYYFGIYGKAGSSITLKRAKLELGAVSTLAYDPPADYGEQLALCQRYCLLMATQRGVRMRSYSPNTVFFTIPTPASMRADPSITGTLAVVDMAGNIQSGFTLQAFADGGNLTINANKNAHGLTDAYLYASTPVVFSADL